MIRPRSMRCRERTKPYRVSRRSIGTLIQAFFVPNTPVGPSLLSATSIQAGLPWRTSPVNE